MRILVFGLLLLLLPVPGVAANRVGLVIGNDDYAEVPKLDKARADAVSVSDRLRGQGFDIITVTDAPRREMNRKIAEFTGRLQPGDTAFVFFAGHGVEIDSENYLLPTDIAAPATGGRDFIKSESIALSGFLDRVRATGARTTVFVIDACRDNPFQATTGRSIGSTRGLGRITAPQGTFVIFSAGAGQQALDELTEDDPAENSVFTRALLPLMAQPGLELRAMMSTLRRDVRDLAQGVSHTQIPAYYDELLGEFYFTPATVSVTAQDATDPVGAPAQTDRPDARSAQMRADFDLAREIGTDAALRAFLETYRDQNGTYVYSLAKQMLAGGAASDRAPDGTITATTGKSLAIASLPRSGNGEEADDPASRTETIRATQRALQRIGCDPGGSDGVIGPRTRQAFGSFLKETGAALGPAELGTVAALRAVQAAQGTVCKTTPRTASAPSGGLTLEGTWTYRAKCPLEPNVTGTVRLRRMGNNTFRGRLNDSLGQTGTSELHLNARDISGANYWPGLTEGVSARLSADGRSFSGRSTVGCRFTANRN